MLCGMSDMPLLRQGVAALNATPPGQWHITQVPRWLPSLAEGCKHIVFFAGTPAAKEGRSFISEIDLQSGPTQLGFDFLVLGKLGRRHFLTLDAGMGFPPLVHPVSYGLRDQTVGLCHLADRTGLLNDLQHDLLFELFAVLRCGHIGLFTAFLKCALTRVLLAATLSVNKPHCPQNV